MGTGAGVLALRGRRGRGGCNVLWLDGWMESWWGLETGSLMSSVRLAEVERGCSFLCKVRV